MTNRVDYKKMFSDLPNFDRSNRKFSLPHFRNFLYPFSIGYQLFVNQPRMVITTIPKVASSSTKCTLIQRDFPSIVASHPDRNHFYERVHNYHGLLNVKSEEQLRGAETVRIVRDPMRRITSAYVNKFIQAVEEPITRDACRFLGKEVGKITFEDFIWYLLNVWNSWLDPHFRPQADFYLFEQYDYSFRLEDHARIETFFMERLGVELVRINDSERIWNVQDFGEYLGNRPAENFYVKLGDSAPVPTWKNFLNEENERAIRFRYADDFLIYETLVP